MKLAIEIDRGSGGGPDILIESGRLQVRIQGLRPRLGRWHWWNDSRPYRGLRARTVMIPVAAFQFEWWGPVRRTEASP